jgi:hypothetical protein
MFPKKNYEQAVAFAVLIIPAFPYMKSRLPKSNDPPPPMDISFFHSPAFWILFVANLVQGLPTFIPTLYLPSKHILFLECAHKI